jgi:hypothetical protein
VFAAGLAEALVDAAAKADSIAAVPPAKEG